MTERERQTPYDITYRWNLKYDTNELIYETDSQIQRYSCQGGGRGEVDGEGGIGSLGLADANWYLQNG